MSKKKLIEAIGDIENEFLEEYSSYVPKNRIQICTTVKVLAACLALILCTGAMLLWVGNDRSSQDNQRLVARNNHKNTDNGNIKESAPPVLPEESNKQQQILITESPVLDDSQTKETEHENTVEPAQSYSLNANEQIKSLLLTDSIETSGSKTDDQSKVVDKVVNEEEGKVPDMELSPDNKEETKVPDEQLQPDNQQKPDYTDDNGQDSSSDSENNVMPTDWNQVDYANTPCVAEVTELNYWRLEVLRYIEEGKDSSTANGSNQEEIMGNQRPDAYIAGGFIAEKNGVVWDTRCLDKAPVLEGWYWFDMESLQWENEYVLQRQKAKDNAMSNVLLLKGDAKLYIMQTKTDAKSLEEANVLYPEEVFGTNLRITYENGMPIYLVENSNGELYVRFLIEDTFITIVDRGFGKDILYEMLKTVKQTF